MINKILASLLLATVITTPACAVTQKKALPPTVGVGDYVVKVENPTYPQGKGPRVSIDQAHHNYQTMADRFQGFAELVKADGFVPSPGTAKFSRESLAKTDILVICNALNKANVDKWALPVLSAFSNEEIQAVKDWVDDGGSLLLISDHMPFPSAVTDMGLAFGVEVQSNFAFYPDFVPNTGNMNLMRFFRYPPVQEGIVQGGTLFGNRITEGNKPSEAVPFVITFTGHAFRMKPAVPFTPVMQLGKGTNILWPSVAEEMGPTTPSSGGDGLYQGVVLTSGKGRVGIFGEASMWSVGYANWENNYPMGFNNPQAKHNQQFILNVMHWLAGGA
ncbi:hypothetical protein [Thalassomonas actiniarum]|uniref:DUF4350 domain-containing protein n=1 Tax=Thalassomonas actiniarum TaxID=485447 RepID=A0AAF0C6E5_9GAMM|nr:hypothetical protein [Thalassomonas actiniarum]WDE02533.1 hypothetical protein SG35_029450 [Thalassomonas actiniarum]